jgi:DNA-binding LacI/PurR family transcriptional regulator
MQSVAEATGLSRFTVSKVLNGTPGVSEATRARVTRACEKLNFVVNQHAASLARGGSQLMGVVVTSIVDPFYGAIIDTAERTAASLGYDLAYRCSYGDLEKERGIARAFFGLKARAIVVSPASSDENLDFWRSLANQIPIVFIDHTIVDWSHVVMTDHYQGGRLVTEHLLSRKVQPLYLGSSQPLRNEAIAARLKGYTEAMAAAGKPPKVVPTDGLVERGDTERFGYEAMSRYLSGTGVGGLRGLACATDAIALGAMKALLDVGLKPGFDVLVAGHDDLPFSAFLNPPLTTVRQPKASIGKQCVEAAVLLSSAKDFKRVPKIREILAPELVVRESTTPPARSKR